MVKCYFFTFVQYGRLPPAKCKPQCTAALKFTSVAVGCSVFCHFSVSTVYDIRRMRAALGQKVEEQQVILYFILAELKKCSL